MSYNVVYSVQSYGESAKLLKVVVYLFENLTILQDMSVFTQA